MKNVLICGISTDMGKCVYEVAERSGINVLCGVDKKINGEFTCPVYKSFEEVRELVDVIIDVSSPDMLDEAIGYAIENGIPLIEGTTGYDQKQKELIKKAAEKIPVFMSYNLSLGVNVLFKLCVETARILKDYDIEIIEKYNAAKKNAPGATTVAIANELNEALGGKKKIVIGRSGARHSNEIGIHCVRGGSIDSEHEVLFIGEKETITLSHVTEDDSLYAEGAVAIIKFLSDKKKGYYTIKDYFD